MRTRRTMPTAQWDAARRTRARPRLRRTTAQRPSGRALSCCGACTACKQACLQRSVHSEARGEATRAGRMRGAFMESS
eukprot:11955778-Alexandrium_andersonii.AAC.1